MANKNTFRVAEAARSAGHHRPTHHIAQCESVLISLGALLHDISHGPLSHEIEKKTHLIRVSTHSVKVRSHYGPYPKHDDYERNPALYTSLLDTDSSTLARVLVRHSGAFWRSMQNERAEHIQRFVRATTASGWHSVEQDILPALLFHLLFFEKPHDPQHAPSCVIKQSFDPGPALPWSLGPANAFRRLHAAWYQPYRHDIIGDTLSADLIDYLLRDSSRLGIHKQPELRLLNFYVLAPFITSKNNSSHHRPLHSGDNILYRCAIDLNDYKRGTVRIERINDIFRLLDLRQEIHEKAVYHRVVQAAVAMLSRATLMIPDSQRPAPKWFYGFGDTSPALCGDEAFLSKLTTASVAATGLQSMTASQTIAQKLAERRVYRPLVVIPGDRVGKLLEGVGRSSSREAAVRELAAITDSSYFSPYFCFLSWCIEKLLEHALGNESEVDALLERIYADESALKWAHSIVPKRVIFWVTPYKQLYKDPALLVCADDHLWSIEDIPDLPTAPRTLASRVRAGIADAETKYEDVWKLYLFISDGLFYSGTLSKLLPHHECASKLSAHKEHLKSAQRLAVRALRCAWDAWSPQPEKLEAQLGTPMSSTELGTRLSIFVKEGARLMINHPDVCAEVSVVAVDQYLHGEQPDDKCRDVRYKYDLPFRGDVFTGTGSSKIDQLRAAIVLEIIRSAGHEPEDFGTEEIKDISCRVETVRADVLDKLYSSLQNARANEGLRGPLLRKLWSQEFGWTSAIWREESS